MNASRRTDAAMAGDYIPMRKDLAEDPDTVSIARSLEMDIDLVVGKLHRFWSWADSHAKNGAIKGVDGAWIDALVGVENFSKALQQVKWLRVTCHGITIPNSDRWLSQSAKARLLAARRQRKHRSRKRNAPTVTKTSPEERRGEESKGEKKEKKSAPKPEYSVSFEQWWKAYPNQRRSSKIVAYQKWKASVMMIHARQLGRSKDEAVKWLLERTEAFAASPVGKGEFCPGAKTWLYQGRYDDDPAAWEETSGNQHGRKSHGQEPGPGQRHPDDRGRGF